MSTEKIEILQKWIECKTDEKTELEIARLQKKFGLFCQTSQNYFKKNMINNIRESRNLYRQLVDYFTQNKEEIDLKN